MFVGEQKQDPPVNIFEGSSQVQPSAPVPEIVYEIRKRLAGEIGIRRMQGTALTPEERFHRSEEGFSSKTGRSEEILSMENDKEKERIQATIANTHKLKGWLTSRGLKSFDNGAYHLETDPIQNGQSERPIDDLRTIDLTVTTPEFDLVYKLYHDRTFEVQIDYTQWLANQRPQYRSGKRSIFENLTSEEAEIIGFYAHDFLNTASEINRSAA